MHYRSSIPSNKRNCASLNQNFQHLEYFLTHHVIHHFKAIQVSFEILYKKLSKKYYGMHHGLLMMQSKAKVSVINSDLRRTRGKAPIFQASASCGSLPLLSTPFCSATVNAASHYRLGRPVWADLFLNRRPGGRSPDYFLGFGLSGISRLTDETTAPQI